MIHVLFHAKSIDLAKNTMNPCTDGLFAAWAAKQKYPEAHVIPAMYGRPPELNLSKGDRIYLLDLTYPASVLESWADRGAEVIVLDHHKSALDDLSGLSDRILKTFDMSRSGAVIAYDYFFDSPVPLLFKYVQDRDLWVKLLPNCDLVSLALSEGQYQICQDHSIQNSLEVLFSAITDAVESGDDFIDELVVIGEELNIEIQQAISAAVSRARARIIGGHCVPYVKLQGQRESQAYSDIGNVLASKEFKPGLFESPRMPMFAAVETRSGGLALRSIGSNNVIPIAKSLGGGGHPRACGCRA